MISVVVPTIAGREASLARTVAAYEASVAAAEMQILVITDADTCGDAWNAGAKLASGDYLHFTADDLAPSRPDWWLDAVAAVDAGSLPVGRIVEHGLDGETRSFGGDFARAPFIRADWWQPMPAGLHYWTDNLLTDRLRREGHQTRFCESYAFTHRPVDVGRLDTAARLERDHALYLAALA